MLDLSSWAIIVSTYFSLSDKITLHGVAPYALPSFMMI
jgi:hypothetical protein